MEYGQGVEPSAKIVASDRRLTVHLMGLWQGLRCGANSWTMAEDLVAALAEDLWADCCFVEIAADGDWVVSRIGETIARRSGVRTVPVRVAQLPPQSVLAASVRELEIAKKTGTPILDEGEVEDETGRPAMYRSIILPLADQEGRLVQFLAGARCRVCLEDS
jgi:hypothetical protein